MSEVAKPRSHGKAKSMTDVMAAKMAAGEPLDPETTELQKLPGFSSGVRPNSAVRMVTLARPVCPNSKITFEKDNQGNLVPIPERPTQQNCQRVWPLKEFGTYWIEQCTSLGHDPFFRTVEWYTTEDVIEDVLDAEGNPTGAKRKVDEYLIPHTVKVPNLAQTAIGQRHNNGEGNLRAIRGKGFKRLRDIGFEEVCQFRNCQKSILPEYTSRKYGAYCSNEHLLLIAADEEGEFLHQPNAAVNGPEYNKVQREREKQLMQIAVFAKGT